MSFSTVHGVRESLNTFVRIQFLVEGNLRGAFQTQQFGIMVPYMIQQGGDKDGLSGIQDANDPDSVFAAEHSWRLHG